MAAAPLHTFQVLTKRPERAKEWFDWLGNGGHPGKWLRANWASVRDFFADGSRFTTYRGTRIRSSDDAGVTVLNAAAITWDDPLHNVWLGVSVEDRARKDRIDELRQAPAAVRFLSIEPLIEDIGELDLAGIDWVIVGGESGAGARPFNVAWARSIVEQCKAAGAACFVKQLGGHFFAPWKVQWDARLDGSFDAFSVDGIGTRGTNLATVWKNGIWHTWDANGTGGENSSAPTVEAAKREALEALARQHVSPIKGWARHRHMLKDRKGGTIEEWPADLRVREFPASPRGSP
jgi:hypothetical protein